MNGGDVLFLLVTGAVVILAALVAWDGLREIFGVWRRR